LSKSIFDQYYPNEALDYAGQLAGLEPNPVETTPMGDISSWLSDLNQTMGGPVLDRMQAHGDNQMARRAAGDYSPTRLNDDTIGLADDVAGGLLGPIGAMGGIIKRVSNRLDSDFLDPIWLPKSRLRKVETNEDARFGSESNYWQFEDMRFDPENLMEQNYNPNRITRRAENMFDWGPAEQNVTRTRYRKDVEGTDELGYGNDLKINPTQEDFVDIYRNKNKQLHRMDGPAVIEADDTGQLLQADWYQRGMLHRLDGPAIERYSYTGNTENTVFGRYYLFNEAMSKEKYDQVIGQVREAFEAKGWDAALTVWKLLK